jgi:predicted DNA-binding transcriptional regulator AlpA
MSKTSASRDHAPAPTRFRRLLDVHETAEYLHISPRTIYNGTGRKSKNPFPVKPKRIGGKLLFDIQDLERYIDSQ